MNGRSLIKLYRFGKTRMICKNYRYIHTQSYEKMMFLGQFLPLKSVLTGRKRFENSIF